MVVSAVRIDKIRRLSENSVAVLRAISDALGDGEGRILYGDISEALGIPRSSVKYAMDQLIQDGIVQIVDGEKLSVRESVVWFEVD